MFSSHKHLNFWCSSYVENAWNALWQKEGFFKVEHKDALKKPRDWRFEMVLPPLNVTGSLHLGHALMGAIEDTIIRYKRLKGYASLWIPGNDHAGIATQSVVGKKILKDEGKYRTDFTREDFIKKVWEWKNMEIKLWNNLINWMSHLIYLENILLWMKNVVKVLKKNLFYYMKKEFYIEQKEWLIGVVLYKLPLVMLN